MELRLLRYFAAVAEAGSLTAAAANLHLSQPSLSSAMAALESELGVSLLVRNARGVELTSAGRQLLDSASRVLGDVDGVVASLRRFGAGVAGSLTIAAVPVLMWGRVPRLLRRFAAAAPDVDVRLLDPPPWTAIDMLHQRTADVAAIVVTNPEGFARRHGDSLDIIDWGVIPLMAALPPDQTDASDPYPVRDLEHRAIVLPSSTAGLESLPEAVEDHFRRVGISPRSVLQSTTIQTAVPLIEAGLASSILPDPDGDTLARFDLTVRALDDPPPPMRAFVLTRSGASRGPVVARLLDHVVSL